MKMWDYLDLVPKEYWARIGSMLVILGIGLTALIFLLEYLIPEAPEHMADRVGSVPALSTKRARSVSHPIRGIRALSFDPFPLTILVVAISSVAVTLFSTGAIASPVAMVVVITGLLMAGVVAKAAIDAARAFQALVVTSWKTPLVGLSYGVGLVTVLTLAVGGVSHVADTGPAIGALLLALAAGVGTSQIDSRNRRTRRSAAFSEGIIARGGRTRLFGLFKILWWRGHGGLAVGVVAIQRAIVALKGPRGSDLVNLAKMQCCIAYRRRDFDGILKIVSATRDLVGGGVQTLAYFEALAYAHLEQREKALGLLQVAEARFPVNPWFKTGISCVTLMAEGLTKCDIERALTKAREAFELEERCLMSMRLQAQCYCELAIRAYREGVMDEYWRHLGEAESWVAQGVAGAHGDYYDELRYVDGYVAFLRQDYRRAVRRFMTGALTVAQNVSRLHLAVLWMIGSKDFSNSRRLLAGVASEARSGRVAELARINLRRIEQAMQENRTFLESLVFWFDVADLPEEKVGALHEDPRARLARGAHRRVVLTTIWLPFETGFVWLFMGIPSGVLFGWVGLWILGGFGL